MKQNFKITSLFLIVTLFSFSQENKSINQNICSQLFDEKGETIPFVKIINQANKTGSYSDSDGRFCIEYGKATDSIVIYSGGEYETFTSIIKNLNQDKIVLTKKTEITLFEEVAIISPKLFVLNEFPYKPGGATLSLEKGGNFCSFIDESQNYSGKLKSISFYLKSFSDEYLIIPSLYEHDIITKSIGRKISIKNYQLDTLKPNQWNNVIILDTIYVPKNGFYIGFECIPKNSKIEFNAIDQKSTLSFGAYYQKVKDGDRTYFSSFQKSSKWFQFPIGAYDKRNLLNLAVKVEVIGNQNNYSTTPIDLVKDRKVKKLLKIKSRNNDLVLKQSTIEELFESVIKVMELNDITLAMGISKIKQEDYEHYYHEVQNSKDFWLTEERQEEFLDIWKGYLENIRSENVSKIDENYYKIVFPNMKKDQNELELYKLDGKWYYVPYSN
jgi:hypothetical protein